MSCVINPISSGSSCSVKKKRKRRRGKKVFVWFFSKMSIYIVSFYGWVFACDLCLYVCTCTSNLSPLQRPCTASDPGSYAYRANLKIEVRAEFPLSYNTICCFIGTVPSSCFTKHLPSNQNYYLSHYLVICN